jgi:hypothetical protein
METGMPTNEPQKEFAPRTLLTAFVIVIFCLLYAAVVDWSPRFYPSHDNYPQFLPEVYARTIFVVGMRDRVFHDMSVPPFPKDAIRVLAPLLLFLVIAPTLMLIGWRKRKIEQRSRTITPNLLFLLFGGFLVIVYICTAFVKFYFAPQELAVMKQNVRVDKTRIEITNNLVKIGLDAARFYIVPKRLGGGGNTMEKYRIPSEDAKTPTAQYSIKERDNNSIHLLAIGTDVQGTISVTIGSSGSAKPGSWIFSGEFK